MIWVLLCVRAPVGGASEEERLRMYKIPITIFSHFPNFLPRLQKVSSLRFLTTSEAKEGGGGGRRYRSSSQKKKKKGGNFSFSCLPINNSCKRAQFRLKSRRQEEEEVGQREIDLSSPCRASFSLCRVQESRAENIDFGQCGEQHKSKKRREERTMDELFPDFCIHAAHSLCCLLLLPSLEKSERNKKSNWTTSFFLSSLFSCRLFFILKAKSFTPIRTGRLNSFRLYTFICFSFSC